MEEIRETPEGRAKARVMLEPDSNWFSGHFPIKPIFPGVAMLGLVEEMVKKMAKSIDRELEVRGFNRVRFKALAFPGQQLLISIPALPLDPESRLTFEITRDRDLICQGQITICMV